MAVNVAIQTAFDTDFGLSRLFVLLDRLSGAADAERRNGSQNPAFQNELGDSSSQYSCAVNSYKKSA